MGSMNPNTRENQASKQRSWTRATKATQARGAKAPTTAKLDLVRSDTNVRAGDGVGETDTKGARLAPPHTAALLDRACRGERRALDELLVANRPRAMALALKVLRNVDDAEDAVQDAFIKVWRYLGRFERRSSFTTWLHRIVMNACLDLLRRQASRPVGVEEPADDTATDPREGVVELTPEAVALSTETTALVHRALDQLSPVHRSALALRELQENTYDEIARACACPVGTVMSRLHHARRRFVEEWQRVLVAAQLLPCAA